MDHSYRKEKIAISTIGKERFWLGVAAGVVAAVAIALFFNYSRELLRMLTSRLSDLIVLPKAELVLTNFFFCLLSAVLGLSVTIGIWMQNKKHHRKRDRFFKHLANNQTQLVFWFTLLAVARLGSILPFVLFATPGYDNHFNLLETHWLLFVLIPAVVYMQSWFTVRLVYGAKGWMLRAIPLCFTVALLLQLTTTVNPEKLNALYNSIFEDANSFIDSERIRAQTLYDITFDDETITKLKQQHTVGAAKQIQAVKRAFSKKQAVALDTLLLQKIMIRNYKVAGEVIYFYSTMDNWPYANPEEVLQQLTYFNVDDNETSELIAIIQEMIALVNTPELFGGNIQSLSETEKRRYYGARYNIPRSISKALIAVRKQLLEDPRYSEFHAILPPVMRPI
ncbi:MAG: hypothetical protein LAT76_10155 [Schleiferiaceae bacterium]|nr:hypothetical protein [Schleiferiaceae bacterium]